MYAGYVGRRVEKQTRRQALLIPPRRTRGMKPPPARGRASCRAARSSWGNSPQWARQLAPAITLSSRGHQTSSQDREGRARSSGNRIWIEFSHERMYLLPIFSFFLSSGGGPWEGAPGGRKKGEGEKERRESRCCTCCLFCARAVCL